MSNPRDIVFLKKVVETNLRLTVGQIHLCDEMIAGIEAELAGGKGTNTAGRLDTAKALRQRIEGSQSGFREILRRLDSDPSEADVGRLYEELDRLVDDETGWLRKEH